MQVKASVSRSLCNSRASYSTVHAAMYCWWNIVNGIFRQEWRWLDMARPSELSEVVTCTYVQALYM